MTDTQILNFKGVKIHAQFMELNHVDFLDFQGLPGAIGSDVRYVRISFIDGKVGTMSLNEFKENLSETPFKLRPARNHS